MILSRFIEHVKKQHWMGAFIELVIVILGVFIGLQAKNRNTARHDRSPERQYLQRLRDDLQLSLSNVDLNLHYSRGRRALPHKRLNCMEKTRFSR